MRTDRPVHRTVAGDSEVAEAVKVLARAQQRLVRDRQRHLDNPRSMQRIGSAGVSQVPPKDCGRNACDALQLVRPLDE